MGGGAGQELRGGAKGEVRAHGVETELGTGWFVERGAQADNLTLKHLSQQRKRHYWRLDCKCITLFQNNTTNRYYKVGLSVPSSLRLCISSLWLLQPNARESYPLPTPCLPSSLPTPQQVPPCPNV